MRIIVVYASSILSRRSLTKAVGRKYCQEREKQSGESAHLHPNNTFLIQQIVDYLDTLTHLGLSLVRHREDGTDELPRLHVFQRRDSVTGSGIDVLSEAGQWKPPGTGLSALLPVFLRGVSRQSRTVEKAYHTVSICQGQRSTRDVSTTLASRRELLNGGKRTEKRELSSIERPAIRAQPEIVVLRIDEARISHHIRVLPQIRRGGIRRSRSHIITFTIKQRIE